MPLEIDTAANHADLFDRIVDFLTAAPTAGPGWTLLDLDTAGSALFEAPGMSGTESIYIGMSLHESVATDAYAIGFWMFRDYNAALPHLGQPGHSGVRYLPIWNTGMPYWLVANAQRLIVVAKVSTTYQSCYVGKFHPQGTPGEYPQPYFIAAPVTSSTTRWSTTSENARAFFDPGTGALISLPSAQWRSVTNFRDSGGEAAATGTNYVWPYSANIGSNVASTRFRELREQLDGGYWLLPLVLLGEDPDVDMWGQLDGAYAVSGFNNATENTVTIDGLAHLIVQNIHRTGRMYYAAIALE